MSLTINNPNIDQIIKLLLKHPYAYGTLSAVILQLLRSLWSQVRTRPKGCRGPFELPILGNSFTVVKRASSILDYLNELSDKYGDTFTIKIWGQPRYIATTNPQNVEFILKKDFESFEKGPVFRERFTELLGNGIFNADGDLWYNQRKTAVHMFTAGRFRDLMMSVFSRNAVKLVEILRKQRDLGQAVDIQDLMYRYTLDSIGHIGFGEDLGSLQTANLPFAIAFDTAQQIVCDRFFSICWPIRKIFHPDEWKFRRALDILNKKAYEMVEERLKLSVEELENYHDFLTMFARVRDDSGKPLYSKKFLRDVVLNFLIAGRDTTAGALTWGIWRLSEHPNVRKRLVEEIDQVMRETGEGLDKPWSYDTLRKGPPYLHAFVHEVLRLHPSVPKDGKTVLRDVTLPTGVKATKGSFMVYLPWSMGRNEKIWGSDAREFKPERWLETDSSGSIGDGPYKLKPKPSQYEFIAFNAGPRLCLGQEMAFLEIKLVLVTLAKYFLLEKVPDHPIQYLSTLTMPMKYGLKMYVRDRPDGKVPLPKQEGG